MHNSIFTLQKIEAMLVYYSKNANASNIHEFDPQSMNGYRLSLAYFNSNT